jgi:ornithine carbamoyltransferase
VLDGEQSIVFDQAENRMHAQKAICLMLLGGAKKIPTNRNKGGLQARSKR